jgi:hypothetical protein
MIIKKIVSFANLNLLLALLFSLFMISGCGKKETTEKSAGEEQQQSTETKSENITENTPLHYKLEAQGEISGTWDIYAKGKQARVNVDMTVAGQKTTSTMYTDGSMMYIITDFAGKKTGMKMDMSKFSEENAKKGEFNPINFKEGCKDCEKIGTDEVIGRKCDVYQDKQGTKYSVYEDKYPLKIVMPKTTIIAKSLDIDVKVSDDMFIPPKDVNYVEMDKMMEGIKGGKDLQDMKDKMKDMKDAMKNYKK